MLKNAVGYIRCLRVIGLPGDYMNLGPGVGLIAPAGIVGAFNTTGTVYFTDIWNGDNGDNGISPDTAFQTIAYALTQCVDDNDDYIIVLDAWNEATPITVSKSRVHIIGVSASPERPYPVQMATGDTHVFVFTTDSDMSELANLDIGGGGTSAGVYLDPTVAMGVIIRNCTFGNTWAGGNTPAYGILCLSNATGIAIVCCEFRGTGGNAGGTITIDGISLLMNVNYGGRITNNILLGCPGVAIQMVTLGNSFVIADNIIACDADTQGSAITLSATTLGCLVTGNKAMFGGAAGGMVQNPYLDLAAAGSNHWAGNMKGAIFVDPA